MKQKYGKKEYRNGVIRLFLPKETISCMQSYSILGALSKIIIGNTVKIARWSFFINFLQFCNRLGLRSLFYLGLFLLLTWMMNQKLFKLLISVADNLHSALSVLESTRAYIYDADCSGEGALACRKPSALKIRLITPDDSGSYSQKPSRAASLQHWKLAVMHFVAVAVTIDEHCHCRFLAADWS